MPKIMDKRQKLQRSKPESDKMWRKKLENVAKNSVGRFTLFSKDKKQKVSGRNQQENQANNDKRRQISVAAFFLVLLIIAIVGSTVSLLNCDPGFRSVCYFEPMNCTILCILL